MTQVNIKFCIVKKQVSGIKTLYADGTSLKRGDIIIVGRGSALSPKDCIILKNYPAEPDFSYWENE